MMTLNHQVLKTLPEYFITTNAEDSTLTDNKSHCASEILRIHKSESIFQNVHQRLVIGIQYVTNWQYTYWLISIQKLFIDIILYSSDDRKFRVHRHILCRSSEKFAKPIVSN
ncbi:unnamed protein product [Adineta steineri]|uniref:BTB domain-containing protein n=2 Tax=Adineta steineri TaxID=433720 RepID=A0A819KEG5_9BILA|nr:unnamed protein product [Adineta steineri]